MSGKGPKMKVYTDLRAEYERKIQEQTRILEKLQNELAGMDKLYRASAGLPEMEIQTAPEKSAAKTKVKNYVLNAVIKRGERGVNAIEVIIMGREEGRELNQASVSSLLSRLKREGTLTFKNERYYPVKSDPSVSIVTPLRPVEAA